MKNKKTIAAPEWFVELWNASEQARNEACQIMHVSMEWMEQAKESAFSEILSKINRGDKEKVMRILDYGSHCREFAWARLRYEYLTKDGDIAQAEMIKYYKETKEIVARSGMVEMILGGITDTLKNIF